MKNEINIIKTVCKGLGITYAQLAEHIGYVESTVNKTASTGVISTPLQKAIELYLKTINREDLMVQSEENPIVEENIVKRVCEEFNLSQKELSELLEVAPTTISGWNEKMPKMAKIALELMLSNKYLDEQLFSNKVIEELQTFDFTALSYNQLKLIKSVIDTQEV